MSREAAPVHFEVATVPPYPVEVGPGALRGAAEHLPHPQVALISDDTVGPLHAGALAATLRGAGREVAVLQVPAGEASKRMSVVEGLQRELARAGLGRDAAVVALGGGVVGDLAGFTAATYLRGVEVVQAPTSLLAMVDAAIGGKTGVNLPEGKNLVGAFWQPRAVVMDVDTLRTLPARVFRAGAVEAFKTGLLADRELADAVRAGGLHREADDATLTRLVAASARVKGDVVARDAHEAGERAVLNLGHTAAHALEAVSGHALPHGEAVAYGLLVAAHLSRARGGEDVVPHVRDLLRWVRPAPLPSRDWEALAPYVRRDKKNRAGRGRWVLLAAVGAPQVVDDVTEAEAREAWRATLDDVDALSADAAFAEDASDAHDARDAREGRESA